MQSDTNQYSETATLLHLVSKPFGHGVVVVDRYSRRIHTVGVCRQPNVILRDEQLQTEKEQKRGN